MQLRPLKNKRAISEIISYVLLVVIAIGISGIVFTFLKVYIPKEKLTCPSDVSLIIQEYNCSSSEKNLLLVLSNKGLWKIDGAYVRLGEEEVAVKPLLTNTKNIEDLRLNYPDGLMPSEKIAKEYKNIKISMADKMEVQVSPIILSESGKQIVCDKAMITQAINC